MIIGISGKSGSGKSTLARNFVKRYGNDNCIHLDIDKVGHHVLNLKEVRQELIENYGTSIIDDNKINRKKLSKIVFDSSKEMDKLTDITWKYMQIEIDKFLTYNKDKIIILDWILLPISKYFAMCDIKLLIDVPYEIRKNRATKRDNISEEAFDLREKASINFDEFYFDCTIQEFNEELNKKLVKKI